ncbi:MAG: hypothetical protein FJ387_11865 [Verrucomicrobia bacterium]|nr:hypothetical protein [Verrucomicrobiota bacterium]
MLKAVVPTQNLFPFRVFRAVPNAFSKSRRQVALQDPLLHQAAALMLVCLQRPDHGLRVGVDALRLEQHPTAERQLPHHPTELGQD